MKPNFPSSYKKATREIVHAMIMDEANKGHVMPRADLAIPTWNWSWWWNEQKKKEPLPIKEVMTCLEVKRIVEGAVGGPPSDPWEPGDEEYGLGDASLMRAVWEMNNIGQIPYSSRFDCNKYTLATRGAWVMDMRTRLMGSFDEWFAFPRKSGTSYQMYYHSEAGIILDVGFRLFEGQNGGIHEWGGSDWEHWKQEG